MKFEKSLFAYSDSTRFQSLGSYQHWIWAITSIWTAYDYTDRDTTTSTAATMCWSCQTSTDGEPANSEYTITAIPSRLVATAKR